MLKKAIERNLQIIVEVLIDICQRVISLNKKAPATTGKEAITKCIQLGMLSSEDNYIRMVQFRNIVVHQYEEIDMEILSGIMNKRLGDFTKFKEEVLNYAKNKFISSQ